MPAPIVTIQVNETTNGRRAFKEQVEASLNNAVAALYDEIQDIPSGPRGEQGLQGEKGEKGDTGDQGIQGIQGERGLQGIQGVQGEKGDKGDPGTSADVAEFGTDTEAETYSTSNPLAIVISTEGM